MSEEPLSKLDELKQMAEHSISRFVNGGPEASSTPEPATPSKFDQLKTQAEQSIKQLRTLLQAVRSPLPTETGDGTPLPEPQKDSTVAKIKEILRDVNTLGIKRVEDLAKVALMNVEGEDLNDKEYWMERLVQAAAVLPNDALDKKVTGNFLTQLWNDLEHPPQTLLGDEYMYRQPDGSGNNYKVPHIGAAKRPYARTVTPLTTQSGELPDPGVLFDSVMARKDPKGKTHPNKVSSMLFYLASIIIHDVFKTNRYDYNISDTSSYLDLAPLYGSTWEDQKRMRTLVDGKIKPDCFSEVRLLTFPAGVGALLIMFNRYHNYVVEQLASINENGRFSVDPKKVNVDRYGESINKRDDDLFQTARLITCGLYVNMILIDYVRTILNLNRTDENWQLDPRVQLANAPTGTGNQVSAEFNLVYRWHAATSTRDDQWTQQLFKEIVPGMSAADAAKPENLYKFLGVLGKKETEFNAKDPMDRPFPALLAEQLTRVPAGPFKGNYKDNDLAEILTSGIEDCANSFGPQQIPTVMKAIEVLGIKQARTWKVATLNEMRKHFKLQPHRTFADITDNKEVQEALKHLYDTPDNVELYPGLVVEDEKKPMAPGSGLCPSYTVSRGVLSDAVALVRGDRYYTSSYTPAALTAWGYREASSDLTIDNGCVFYKLLTRALPNNFDPASVYVHYPMTVPTGVDGMKDVLTRLGKADKYVFERPTPIPQPTIIFSYPALKQILDDQETFHVTWGKAMEFLMGPSAKNFMLAGDGPKNAASRVLMEKALYQGGSSRAIPKGNEKWLKAVRDFYAQTTTRLLKEKSYKLAGTSYVDIVRDVGNLAHVHFSAELFGLPLKTAAFPHGIFTEQQLYLVFVAVFVCIFFDVDPAKSFQLRQQAKDATQTLGKIVQVIVNVIKKTDYLPIDGEEILAHIMPPSGPLRAYGSHMIAQLVKADPDVADLVWGNIMGVCGGMVANQGQLLGQALDWFMSPEGQKHWPKVVAYAKADTPEADDALVHYFMEASRLAGETGLFREVQKPTTVVDRLPKELGGDITYNLKKGDKILVNLKSASRDPTLYPNPDSVDLHRDIDSYVHFGRGAHQCLGLPMVRVSLSTMLKEIARLDNLQPAPVAIGGSMVDAEGKALKSTIKKVMKEFVPGDGEVLPESWHYHAYLTEDWDMYFPFPTSELLCL